MTQRRKVAYISLCLLAAISLSFVFIARSHSGRGLLRVSFLNVGQGDAIFIQAPNGAQFVIDGGPGDNLLSELGSVIPFYDHSIDGIMVTNPDLDHYAGFIGMLSRYSVGLDVEAGTVSHTPNYESLQKIITEKKIPKVIAKRGMKIILDRGAGVYIEILFPDRDVSNLSTNDGSIISKLVYGETSVMLQGDSPQKIEQYLISLDKNILQADILKLGHHSSRTSTASEYVAAVSPKYAVASLGKDNSYGFPHQETIDTLAAAHVPFLRTDIEGRITFVSDGKNFMRRY